jgi:hypothetical protein
MGGFIPNALLAGSPTQGASPLLAWPPIVPPSVSELTVDVLVDGVVLPIPKLALSAGLADLRLGTGECVGMRDYASGVGLVLTALAKGGMIIVAV